ncbi:hypothetical protein FJ651_15515 [Paucihalobacter ruber]|uniref:Uncharacterized protein n=1 Tax=Paucihalobacter ruber TaxID=2567861 RepID=A0A506PC89_9FLAO|nr:hypothetical protein FJ651_15515 [Paucihalobacter ruber]
MWGLAVNFTSTHQVGNSAGISKVCENKQLLIAIVGNWLFLFIILNQNFSWNVKSCVQFSNHI